MENRIRTGLAALLLAPWLAAAQEQGFTNRATELKEHGAPQAPTVASLAEGTEVRVLERGGGWTRVEAGGRQGWVRVFHLRFPATAQVDAPSAGTGLLSSLGSALGGNRDTARGATLATTGVRGLTAEELKNARPDPAALARMQSYRADAASAERFAREAKLAAAVVDLPGDGK